ncbi:hypothetical protein [Wolbachia endosymbiont of Atemnus politus]|uniref:hypothetical protein n=1 Tax=Wolbachia endosymbiont of Atemnus politus TaxID=2682840 RepID=UPI001572A12A|nr:hypothetical protein [Wolbachia endosymbiont of Atemnus politus]
MASGIALYIMKMPIVAAVVGIIRLAFALYSTLKPNTKLEEVERPVIQSSLNLS